MIVLSRSLPVVQTLPNYNSVNVNSSCEVLLDHAGAGRSSVSEPGERRAGRAADVRRPARADACQPRHHAAAFAVRTRRGALRPRWPPAPDAGAASATRRVPAVLGAGDEADPAHARVHTTQLPLGVG